MKAKFEALKGSEVTLKTGVTMKKSLKFSEVYIAYLPLVVFFLNLLYGLFNIEGVGDTDSRYNLFFAIFGFIPTIFGYGISFWLIFWWGYLMCEKQK